MSQEAINQSIEALHAEIDQLDTPDSDVKDKLLSLISEVEKQMQNPDKAEHKDANLQTLPTLIEQFEAEHPKVTASLSRLLNTLSSVGI
ncbi:MAG: DUF4404 family protein [Cyanobacteria bacterium P01_C01_bin.69]